MSSARDRYAEFSALYRSRWFVHLASYGDESGTHDVTGRERGASVALLAAFLAPPSRWIAFTGEWQAALDEDRICTFHTSEFMDKKRRADDPTWPYYRWSEDRRNGFMAKLADAVINEASPIGIVASVSVRDLDALHEAVKKRAGAPYYFCLESLFQCLVPELENLEPPMVPGESVSFFFDWQTEYEEIALKRFKEYQKHKDPMRRLGTIAFARKECEIPLQAADAIAYFARQHLERRRSDNTFPVSGTNWFAPYVEDEGRVKFFHYDADSLRNVEAQVLRAIDAGLF